MRPDVPSAMSEMCRPIRQLPAVDIFEPRGIAPCSQTVQGRDPPVGLITGVANPLDRCAAVWAGLAIKSMNLHALSECSKAHSVAETQAKIYAFGDFLSIYSTSNPRPLIANFKLRLNPMVGPAIR